MIEEIKAINEADYLFLQYVSEPEVNLLALIVEEGMLSGNIESTEITRDVQRIVSAPYCRSYEILWENYVSYNIMNESYGIVAHDQIYEGKKWRIYSKSEYMNFIKKTSFASEEYPGPLTHWCILTEHHLIDVISWKEPKIRLLEPDEIKRMKNEINLYQV